MSDPRTRLDEGSCRRLVRVHSWLEFALFVYALIFAGAAVDMDPADPAARELTSSFSAGFLALAIAGMFYQPVGVLGFGRPTWPLEPVLLAGVLGYGFADPRVAAAAYGLAYLYARILARKLNRAWFGCKADYQEQVVQQTKDMHPEETMLSDNLKFVYDTFYQAARKRNKKALERLVRNLALIAQGQVALGAVNERGLTFPQTPFDEIVRGGYAAALSPVKAIVQNWSQSEGKRKVLADLTIHPGISFPWKQQRFTDAINNETPWKYDPSNHQAYFLEPLGIVVFVNGHHSGWRGILDQKGQLPSTPVDLRQLVRAGLRVKAKGDAAVWTISTKESAAHRSAGTVPVRWSWWALVLTAVQALEEAQYSETVLPAKEVEPDRA